MVARKSTFWGSLAVATLICASLHAQDANPDDWTGWYVNAFGAYVSGELNSNDPTHGASTGDYDDDGPMAGVSIGLHRAYSNDWLGGVELMLPLYMKKGTAVDKLYFPGLVTYEASYQFGALVDAKWGKRLGRFLPYVYGAVGFVNVDGRTYNVDENDNYSPGFVQSAAATHFLWQLGGGVGFKVNDLYFVSARVAAFIGAQADHTMPWNEPGPNLFGYDAVIVQLNVARRFGHE